MTTNGSSPAITGGQVRDSNGRTRDMRVGALLLILAGFVIFMGIITAEALYPATYTTNANAISDLGGTEPPDSVVLQPSATIFDLAMMTTGVMVAGASWFVHQAFRRRSVTIPIAILGVAALGVGVFPGNTGTIHAIFAMFAFVSGGVAALGAARVTTTPFRQLSGLLGAITLVVLGSYMLVGDAHPLAGLGIGGIERWIVYPVIVWLIAFGGYLAGRPDQPAR